ncbi:MAG: response regulator [Comamonadaceae bacterium]|nr:response regulator [Comamonadaceae bacterium]
MTSPGCSVSCSGHWVRGAALVDCADSIEAARPLFRRNRYDLIVLDIALPGVSGIDWLHELRQDGFAGDVVMMTAYADLDTAIDALRAGAADFLLKPFSLAQALNAIQRCFERSQLARENFVLRREVSTHAADVEGVVGQSEVMLEVCDRLRRIARHRPQCCSVANRGPARR